MHVGVCVIQCLHVHVCVVVGKRKDAAKQDITLKAKT